MEDAIASKISDYLDKAQNPGTILLRRLKNIESSKL